MQLGLSLQNVQRLKALKQQCLIEDRFLYHGRVKALADGLREGGLKI